MSTENAEDKKVEEQNPLGMSDEDIMNQVAPGAAAEAAAQEVVSEGGETTAASEAVETAAGVDQPAAVEGAPAEDRVEQSPVEGEAKPAAAAEGQTADPEAKPNGAATETAPPDYEALYKRLMGPIRANGKTIELKTPEELIQLAQMGANYTRKMQDLVPHRRVLTMLQNNDLMDEGKLSFLIDLDKKNPEAIKKLLKESGIDPLEIDTASEPAYSGGSHLVTDVEVNLRTALEELGSTPEGQETLKDINTRWDQASKKLLLDSPETMAVIHAQREVGIYDRIVEEIDRRTTLGQLQTGTPFLQAYKIVGDELTAANAFNDLREKHEGSAATVTDPPPGQEGKGPNPQPVATRVVTPKPLVTNGDAASAAAATRAAPAKAQVLVNPLAMSDDEFLKKFEGRL